jgi:hypothetical protein
MMHLKEWKHRYLVLQEVLYSVTVDVDGTNILEEITASMFTAELHHLDTYISQPITLKHGCHKWKDDKYSPLQKSLLSCIYNFPFKQNKMMAVQKKPHMIIYISTLKGTLLEGLTL